MPSKEAPKTSETEAPPPPVKSRKKLFLLIAILVLVLAVAGIGAVLLLKKKNKAHSPEEATTEEVQDAANVPKKPPVFLNLEPFTVNLQPENGEQFLQVVASLRVTDEKTGEQVKVFMPQIRHEILALLSSKKASEISSTEGREALAEEIKETTNEILGASPKKKKKKKAKSEDEDPITGVFFTQFIVQ